MTDESWAFERDYTASPEHIDELGHVNNAVWVSWIQDIAREVEGLGNWDP